MKKVLVYSESKKQEEAPLILKLEGYGDNYVKLVSVDERGENLKDLLLITEKGIKRYFNATNANIQTDGFGRVDVFE